MSASHSWVPKGVWITGFALIAMGGGLSSPFVFPAFGTDAIFLSEKGEKFSTQNLDHPYTYNVGNRRDPFLPSSISHTPEEPTVTGLPESVHAEEGVRVLGIISGKRGYQAILKLPNGERVVVGPGSLLEGLSLSVTDITNDSVVVAQPLEDNVDSRILETTLFLSP